MTIVNFSQLQSVPLDALMSSNATLTSLPSVLLDSLMPGYGLLSRIIFSIFGFDIGLVVSGCVVVYGLFLGARLLYLRCFKLFSRVFMCSIQVEDEDELFNQILSWIAEQRMTKRSRSLKAVTHSLSSQKESEQERNAADDDVLDETGIFNFEKWSSTIPPQYEPNYGSDRFWFNGRMFFFVRQRKDNQRNPWARIEDQFLAISCIGRRTEPIKELLSHIKRWRLSKDSTMTAVYRPSARVGKSKWELQSQRPSRPITTVSLDNEQKAEIVRDINDYLHPASARWYAARGIPYRRGYLFHGPPGTGKTSLSFALAGIFGLDIYCASIMESGMTESDLNMLFSKLPRRCIVLLEDIDSAGLRRPDELDANKDAAPVPVNGVPLPPDVVNTGQPPAGGRSQISLSGLLNAIDGVASHEGRVLIMTTNCPNKLDKALIRPGRVDLQVGFTLATKDQIRDIFVRMYSTDRDDVRRSSKSASETKASNAQLESNTALNGNSKVHSSQSRSTISSDQTFLSQIAYKADTDSIEPEKLERMADEFAELLPCEEFSPAEVQGFLLMRKKEPQRALAELEAWRDGILAAKKEEEAL